MEALRDVSDELKQTWMEAEDKFFGGLPTEQPELYQKGVQVVRALADALEDIFSPKELESVYGERDEEWARQRAEAIGIGIPRRLNLPRARRAAFQLRYNEVRPFFLSVLSTLTSLDPEDEGWHLLYEQEGEFTGRTFHRQLELHTPDARALFLHPFLSKQGRYIHVVDGFVMDLQTGERTEEEPAIGESYHLDSREEALQKFRELRQGHVP